MEIPGTGPAYMSTQTVQIDLWLRKHRHRRSNDQASRIHPTSLVNGPVGYSETRPAYLRIPTMQFSWLQIGNGVDLLMSAFSEQL